jgi:glycosyltransferase involved in cell wall biosynthesis
MFQNLVSLIIPIYNSQPFLEKCLTSAVEQTLRDIEIILIDDGSDDDSISIIQKFAQTDTRIRVLKQHNKGPGAARNLGLSVASGNYVAFMDSDDWIDSMFLEKMYNAAESNEADVVICNHKTVIHETLAIPFPKRLLPKRPSYKKALKQAVKDSGIQGYVWDKLYRRSLFNDNNISYPEGLYYEDLATTFKLFYYSKRSVFLKEALYYYLQRKNSISKKIDPKPIFDRIKALDIMKTFLKSKDILTEYTFEFQYLCIKMWFADLFCLALIYATKGSTGFFRDAVRITRMTHTLLAIKSGHMSQASERKRLLTRI